MPTQFGVTVRAAITPGHADTLKAWLTALDADPARRAELFPFERLPVHFARLVVLDDAVDLDGQPLPASLMFFCDADGALRPFLYELADAAVAGLDEAFGRCEGYPAPANATVHDRVRFLRERMISADATYVNTTGRSVRQVRDEARLRDAVERFVDQRDWTARRPDDVRQAVRDFLGAEPSLRWALKPAKGPGLIVKAGDVAHLLTAALALLLLSPLLVLVVPLWLVALRLQEMKDPEDVGPPDPAHLRELTDREDLVVQNQFSAVGYLKPGKLRQVTVTSVLWAINVAARHVFNKGDLAGVKTIHFARWVFIDDGRRMIFTSNYDGSLENYMDDFIDKIAWSLNAAFSNGVGYPKTKWLIFAGANDEQKFKNYIRLRQIPTQLWYSAYPSLSAANIADNAALRAGLSDKSKETTDEWVRRL